MIKIPHALYLTDLSIGKALKDEDEVTLYKAYMEDDIGDEIKFNTDDDYLSINQESAVCFLIKNLYLEGHRNFIGKGVIILGLTYSGKDIRKVPIWNTETHNGERPTEWFGTAELMTRYYQRKRVQIIRALITKAEINEEAEGEIATVEVALEETK